MFDNIGGKIQKMAKIVCWLLIVLFAIIGVVMMFNANVIAGLIYIVMGVLMAWGSSIVLHGFGELVEDVSAIRYDIHRISKQIENGTAAASVLPDAVKNGSAAEGWQCKKCGKKNSNALMICGDCGANR